MLLNCGVGGDSWESPLDCKKIQPVNPKGNKPWIFIGRTEVEAETPILWPPDAKHWLIGKDADSGKDGRQEEKRTTEDELFGWHHQLNGHGLSKFWEFVKDKEACSPWGHKKSDITEWLNWTDLFTKAGIDPRGVYPRVARAELLLSPPGLKGRGVTLSQSQRRESCRKPESCKEWHTHPEAGLQDSSLTSLPPASWQGSPMKSNWKAEATGTSCSKQGRFLYRTERSKMQKWSRGSWRPGAHTDKTSCH